MKKIVFIFLLMTICTVFMTAETTTTAPAQATVTAKDPTFLENLGGLFAPSKPKDVTLTAREQSAAEAASLVPEKETFTMAGKLLITGDVFSTAACAVMWVSYAQGLEDYEEAIDIFDNTTLENYDALVSFSREIDERETAAWVSSGICFAFLAYTVADIIWLHSAFPLEPKVSVIDGINMMTLNYGF